MQHTEPHILTSSRRCLTAAAPCTAASWLRHTALLLVQLEPAEQQGVLLLLVLRLPLLLLMVVVVLQALHWPAAAAAVCC